MLTIQDLKIGKYYTCEHSPRLFTIWCFKGQEGKRNYTLPTTGLDSSGLYLAEGKFDLAGPLRPATRQQELWLRNCIIAKKSLPRNQFITNQQCHFQLY